MGMLSSCEARDASQVTGAPLRLSMLPHSPSGLYADDGFRDRTKPRPQ